MRATYAGASWFRGLERMLASRWAPSGVGLACFALYLSGVCPFALAGDASIFQLRATTLALDSCAQTHSLYLVLGHVFLKLPWPSVPFGLTLMSAICGAIAVALLFAVVRLLTKNGLAALSGATSLAVAHTMWFHAVVTEVYALNAALLTATLYFAVGWSQEGRPRQLFTMAFLAGVACSNHLLAGLSLAVLAGWVAWQVVRGRRPWGHALLAAGFALLGMTLLLALFVREVHLAGFGAALRRTLFGGSGITGDGAMDYSGVMGGGGRLPLRQIAASLGAFAYNFPGIAVLLGVAGLGSMARERTPAGKLLIALFAVHTLFGATYMVSDFWVFLLPAWVVFAVAVGVGCDRFTRTAATAWPTASLVVAVASFPVALYAALPRVIDRMDLAVLREKKEKGQMIAAKDYWGFYLWPPKSHVDADARWAAEVFEVVPQGGVLMLREPYEALILYEQVVERRRRDLKAVPITLDAVRAALERAAPLFVASPEDLAAEHIDPNALGVRLVRSGPLWRLAQP